MSKKRKRPYVVPKHTRYRVEEIYVQLADGSEAAGYDLFNIVDALPNDEEPDHTINTRAIEQHRQSVIDRIAWVMGLTEQEYVKLAGPLAHLDDPSVEWQAAGVQDLYPLRGSS